MSESSRQILTDSLIEIRRLKAELKKAKSLEPIAVIGMACRAPGEVVDLEGYWKLLAEGRDAIGPFPKRWQQRSLYDADPAALGKTYAKEGGFLHEVDRFDADFFGIAPREAASMDPQQRILLEVGWEALEHAGILPHTLSESITGVYVGSMGSDYGDFPLEDLNGYVSTGSAASVLSGRLAYVLGLQGPAITIDTACSSSLVSLHLACNALRLGECRLALAGGVQVMSGPTFFVEFSRLKGLARGGRCRSFSAEADGVIWAEGCGMLVLKRLSDAQQDGDRVLAVLKASAVNQDGRSQGLTAPNGPSQQRVIQRALSLGGLDPSAIDVVEAHGTGTQLGDPIEAGALAAVFGPSRPVDRPLWLGSVKSNIGHASAAAGALSVIKMVLALQHEQLPRTLHASQPTPHIGWASSGLSLLQQSRAWPRDPQRVRRGGVSGFGLSGTNAHLIVEESPVDERDAVASSIQPDRAYPFVLSAKSEVSLTEQAARLATQLGSGKSQRLQDVAASLVTRRTSFSTHRAVVVASTSEALRAQLANVSPEAKRAPQERLALVFSGQGSQRLGMGDALAERFRAFREARREVYAALEPHLGVSLERVLSSNDSNVIRQTGVAQPAVFAFQVALFRWLARFGVEGELLAGHSVGEFAVAHLAGVLSLEHAAKLVAARAQLMQALPSSDGVMASVDADEAVLHALLSQHPQVEIAAFNGPRSTVLSGASSAVEKALRHLEGAGQRVKRLEVSHAFHSAQMDPMLEAFGEVAQSVTYGEPQRRVVSTVTGEELKGSDYRSPDYWVRQIRRAVRFGPAVQTLASLGVGSFVEVSATPVLASAIAGNVDGGHGLIVAPTRGGDEASDWLQAVGKLWARGWPVRWDEAFADAVDLRPAELPTYAFSGQKFWTARHATVGGSTSHPLLSSRLAVVEGDLFVAKLRHDEPTWLGEHRLFGRAVVPGTAVLEMVLAAGRVVGLERLQELTHTAAMVLPEAGALEVHVLVKASEGSDGRRDVKVSGRLVSDDQTGPWTEYGKGVLEPRAADDVRPPSPEFTPSVDVAALYEPVERRGFHYGPSFRGLRALGIDGSVVLGDLQLPQGLVGEGYSVHPALLDAALHGLFVGADERESDTGVPFSWSGVTLRPNRTPGMRVTLRPLTGRNAFTVCLWDQDGQWLGEVESLHLRAVEKRHGAAPQASAARDLFRMNWMPCTATGAGSLPLWSLIDLSGKTEGALRDGADGVFRDEQALITAVTAGAKVPEHVVLSLLGTTAGPLLDDALRPLPTSVLDASGALLGRLQRWLGCEQLQAQHLTVVTQRAVAVDEAEAVDLVSAPLWGLLRTVQNEHPGRVTLLDVDDVPTEAMVREVFAVAESQLVVRAKTLRKSRLARVDSAPSLVLPEGRPWTLRQSKPGSFDGLVLTPIDETTRPLEGHQVRFETKAAGLNFRDVLTALDFGIGDSLGHEGAGVVVEVGPLVTRFAVGDQVFGFGVQTTFAPTTVSDERALLRMPSGLSFAQAACLPVAFTTAHHALVTLAQVRAGDKVLIHAATGGTGLAALQIARHLGAEVFCTASPWKHPTLRALGVPESHIASSRTTAFEAAFREVAGSIDVVLNSLTNEALDASLRLLGPGGRFIEIGKTDVRDPAAVSAIYPSVRYRAFDLKTGELELDELAQVLAGLQSHFDAGALRPLPTQAFDIRDARAAFRHMGQARHVGKIALTVPQDRWGLEEGTVLVTGGTGTLGAMLARHLVTNYGAKHLVLCARSAEHTALRDELLSLGATEVRIAKCDAADRGALAGLLSSISQAHPLRAVVHAAGVLEDAVVEAQTEATFQKVFRPKIDAAWNLHELTLQADLTMFVMYSSASGWFGAGGQSNYAAANTFLDALAAHRRAKGIPATAIAWGYWSQRSGMTSGLTDADLARMRRFGMSGLSDEQGLSLFDAALRRPEPALAAMHLLPEASEEMPPLFADVFRRRTSTLEQRPNVMAGTERRRERLLELVQAEAASVLGTHVSRIEPTRLLTEFGLDSLMLVELRNRLNQRTGLKLPATVLFDHPTAEALSIHLEACLAGPAAAPKSAKPAVERSKTNEPIAIVGMGCRFPGGVSGPADLWRLLADEGLTVGPFPTDRGWPSNLYHPDASVPGTSSTNAGSFLDDAQGFDAAFFGINRLEAAAMDPQQRLLLEGAWQALEHARIKPDTLSKSSTGVYVGSYSTGYANRSEALEGYLGTGTAGSIASGRIAYTLGLEGPALTIDTACSSSLVAIHLACRALRARECDYALAGGATVISTPDLFIDFSRQRGLSSDGRCKPFSQQADGVGWSEGMGMLVLRRLSDAQRENAQILAVISGSAVNQDGRSQGLTAPSGAAQQKVIQQALREADLTPADLDVVETHGTGTTLGDPIEANALLEVFAGPREEPLWLGAVKSNIGHTQAAAGVAGVIKMVMAMQHQTLPRNLSAERPSKLIDWERSRVRLLSEPRPWGAKARRRRAGVSSFGFSGTNAHVILEEPPTATLPPTNAAPAARTELFVISGKTEPALKEAAAKLGRQLVQQPERSMSDLSFSLATTRIHHEQRAAIVAGTSAELQRVLSALANGESPDLAVCASASWESTVSPKTVFVFPGQGSQWHGMGRQLLREEAAFREAMERCDRAIRSEAGWSVLEELTNTEEASRLSEIEVIQPTLFAMSYSLAALWRSWGVVPDAVVGHSMGEVAAACVAGALSLADAVKVICQRSRLLMRIRQQGEMASVNLPVEDAERAIAAHGARLSIAVSNARQQTVLSGDPGALTEVLEALTRRGVEWRRVKVDVASHSPQVDSLREDLLKQLATVTPHSAEIPMLSTVTGEWLQGPELTASYWVDNLRKPVRFYEVVKRLRREGFGRSVEQSPHPVLVTAVEEIAEETGPGLVPVGSLRRDRDERTMMLESLGALHVHGARVNWERVFSPGARTVDLPTYPWQRERFWMDRLDPVPDSRATPVPVREAPSAELLPASGTVVDLVTAELVRLLRLPAGTPIAKDRPLPQLGVDSLVALELRNALGRRFKTRLPARLAFDCPTVEAITEYLVTNVLNARAPVSAIRPARGSEPRVRLVCFPPAAESDRAFSRWVRDLPAEVELQTFGFVPPGPAPRSTAAAYLSELVQSILTMGPQPYVLFGHSLGALVAWRVALELLKHGSRPSALLVSAAMTPAKFWSRHTPLSVDEVRTVIAALRKGTGSPAELPHDVVEAYTSDIRLCEALPRPDATTVPIPIVAYLGKADPLFQREQAEQWRDATSETFRVEMLEGDHAFVFDDVAATPLIARVQSELAHLGLLDPKHALV